MLGDRGRILEKKVSWSKVGKRQGLRQRVRHRRMDVRPIKRPWESDSAGGASESFHIRLRKCGEFYAMRVWRAAGPDRAWIQAEKNMSQNSGYAVLTHISGVI